MENNKVNIDEEVDKFNEYMVKHTSLATSSRFIYLSLVKRYLENSGGVVDRELISEFVHTPIKPKRTTSDNRDRNYIKKFAIKHYLLFKNEKKLIESLEKEFSSIRQFQPLKIKNFEIDRFFEFCNKMEDEIFKTLLLTAYFSASRISALLNLTRGELLIEKSGNKILYKIILHDKGGVTYQKYIHEEAGYRLVKLSQGLNSKDKIFLQGIYSLRNLKSKQTTPYQAFYSKLKNESRKNHLIDINAGISWHWIRSARAKHIYKQNKDILFVKDILKHKSIDATMRYVDTSEERSLELVNSDEKELKGLGKSPI